MSKQKLILDDVFEEVNYILFAIHCSIADYRLAYLLNKHLGINLNRKMEDLDFDHISASYSIFEWQDMNHHTTWNLINNKSRNETDKIMDDASLFGMNEKTFKTHNLILEHRTVDYFLKISTDGLFYSEKAVLNQIQEIPQVVTTYGIDATQLKSRNNLIFN